eukprot:TRINITY_DN6012_c0_g1_i4.p1 TRINITY_DN6012_c0_g1~~TRINITY_DN6012_c0_g1_i4.p1  ORF type:complete len:194 (-),score=75.71 TRINITY_DN6012_c0_g1_i4:15-596(-)
MTFEGVPFFSLSELSVNVPLLIVGGLAKRFLVPGWRLGWIHIHDRNNAFDEIRVALGKLSQVILGPSTLAQCIVPYLLNEVPQSFHDETMAKLQESAMYCVERLEKMQGLTVIKPEGAMYVMTRIDIDAFPDFKDDREFAQALISEQSVFVLPGQCFLFDNYFRIVFCATKSMLEQAFDRMEEFVNDHFVKEE